MRCQTTAPKLARRAGTAVALAVLTACVLVMLPASLFAQGREMATTAVTMFQDLSGRQSRLLETKATDAVALALQEAREYLVTPTTDVDRELKALGLTQPLSLPEAVRLGRRLDVNSVTSGQVLEASVEASSGRASVRLQILMIDVAAEEPLDGAVSSVETKAYPGWHGSEADILNEALRQAAEQTVAKMLSTRVARGTIEAVVSSGQCEINLGAQDGIQSNMRMVVMRPVYVQDLQKVVLRKIGSVDVASVQADICYAVPHANVAPRTGDYVLRIYEPATKMEKAVQKKRRHDTFLVAAAGALLAGVIAVAMNGNSSTNQGSTVITYLHQNFPGDDSEGLTIRAQYLQSNQAYGHLLFRGSSAGFPADAPYLTEVSGNRGEERILYMDDFRTARLEQTQTITVDHRDETGAPVVDTVDCTWIHEALVPGSTYFHRIRRVTPPNFPPGTNPPGGTTGSVHDRPRQVITNTIDQSSDFPMISQPSNVAGPVTYMTPSTPFLITAEQNPSLPITFEWSQVGGAAADEYMLQVFPPDDPTGVGQPRYQQTGIRPPAGGGDVVVTVTFPAGTFSTSSPDAVVNFYWRVGARKSVELGEKGQGVTQVEAGAEVLKGWLLSTSSILKVVNISPPPPAGSTKGGKHARPLPGTGTQLGSDAPAPVPPAKGQGRGKTGSQRIDSAQPTAPTH